MKIAPLPANESNRLASLYKYHILDTAAEKDFDDIVRLASNVCQAPISVISLIDRQRQWFKARLGLTAAETPRDQAFCAHAILQKEMMVVPDASQDDRFFDNPLVTGWPDIRFYAGMPLTMRDGTQLGTLCVIDHHPRELTEDQKECLQILSKQVVNLLELRLKIRELDSALHTVEQQKAALQKLIEAGNLLLSVIGHDLRSPLATVVTLMEVCSMKDMTPAEFDQTMAQIKTKSYAAIDLLSDMLEWAEDQFTGRVMQREDIALHTLTAQLIEDNRTVLVRKGNQVHNNIPQALVARADRRALAFMIRNLLLNANKFTDQGIIEITAETQDAFLRVSVKDNGMGMTGEQVEKLFDPTSRSSTPGTQGEKGSGLGLHLCQEFAHRQGGDICVESTPGQGSRFSFTISREAAKNSCVKVA